MKNNSSLYFDMWRKKNFKSLIEAYIDSAANSMTKNEMVLAFGYALDKFVEGGKGTYTATEKQWSTVYVLGRELGVFYEKNIFEAYSLSPLAKKVYEGEISLEQYLVTYFLNFNQLVDGVVIHPLREILLCLADHDGKITLEDIKSISKFKLQKKTEKNQHQIANVLANRLIDAEILIKSLSYYQLNKYRFSDLFDSINLFEGSPQAFEKITHTEYVDLLCRDVNLHLKLNEVYKK